jgi:putative hydrolase of the HAD superfamily
MDNNTSIGEIKALFLDIGGVLLNNGWGHESRYLAADKFGLNRDEMDERHEQVYRAYQLGEISLDQYLQTVVFYRNRSFAPDELKTFMFEQSKAIEGSMEFLRY